MTELAAIIRYELSRTLTAGRTAWWFVLAGFPILIAILIRAFPMSRARPDTDIYGIWSVALYLLVPCITCAMGVLLSAAPAIANELEQRNWVYLATRPNGIFWLLLGKYVVAVSWTTTAALSGLTIAVLFTGLDTRLRLWLSLCGLSVLSSMAYAAVFLLIGTLFPKRAMVSCVAWTAAVEGMISLIPAVINRLTVQYRLRSLFVEWAEPGPDISSNPLFASVLADSPGVMQIVWLLILTAVMLSTALVVAHKREFTAAAESDV